MPDKVLYTAEATSTGDGRSEPQHGALLPVHLLRREAAGG